MNDLMKSPIINLDSSEVNPALFNYYEELKHIPISAFIEDIIRNKIYCVVRKIFRRTNMLKILSHSKFKETILNYIKEINEPLASNHVKIIELKYTKLIDYILKTHSLLRIYDDKIVIFLSINSAKIIQSLSISDEYYSDRKKEFYKILSSLDRENKFIKCEVIIMEF